jgi:uncharacterized protein
MKFIMANDTVILIFAKAPIPGAVKTRMIPKLGAEGAAMLHTALVERVIETALSTDMEVVLCCAPDTTHTYFADCADDFDLPLTPQLADDNLGKRMLHSLNEALEEWPHALLIGADCAAFTKKHLLTAAEQLLANDIVITPAEDGGYVLVGANKTRPTMFDHIDWGTETVMAQQRVALDAARLQWVEMPTLWDVDRPDDLPRLQSLKPPLEFFWPT